MSGPLRNKQGCWTCRLRRKKCDEKRPSCVTCEALLITCYGYGPKPDWMDGGSREKSMADDMKQIVKQTSRRKGRLGTTMTRIQERYGESVIRIASKKPLVTSEGSSPIDIEVDTGADVNVSAPWPVPVGCAAYLYRSMRSLVGNGY